MVKAFAILLILFGIVVWIVNVLVTRLKQSQLSKEVKSDEVEKLQGELVDKVRNKIELTQRSQRLRKQKDDLISEYIYKQDIVQELGSELQTIYSREYSSLRERYPSLTDLDLLVLSLLGLEMNNDEICEIVHMEKRTLYRRRQLISQRMNMSSTDLEAFATEYFASKED